MVHDETDMLADAFGSKTAAVAVSGAHQQRGAFAGAGLAAAAASTVDRQVPSVSPTTTDPLVMAAILAPPST